MPDVVQGGLDEERSSVLPTGARRVALVLALATAALLVSRSGLLSAGAPDQPDGASSPTAKPVAKVSRLVGVVDGHLVRPDQDDWSEGARLPESLMAPLVPVPDPIVGLSSRGPGTLAGVADGLLFVVGTEPGATARPIGRARSVVAATSSSLVLWRGDRVVELDTGTGRILDPAPFPGFDSSEGWFPEGLVAVTGTHPLLMSRSLPDGLRQELALAWPDRRVKAGTNPLLQPLGVHGPRLLGIADDWVLTQPVSTGCSDCVVEVVTVTRDDVLVRDVLPPTGWLFVVGPPAGRTREALLPVRRENDETVQALARLVPGGDSALLVGGTEGVDIDAGLVDTPDGDVFMIVRPPAGGMERVSVWRPGRAGRAELVPGGMDLPETARLVCVCG